MKSLRRVLRGCLKKLLAPIVREVVAEREDELIEATRRAAKYTKGK